MSPEDGAVVVDLAIAVSGLWDAVRPWVLPVLCCLLALAGVVVATSSPDHHGSGSPQDTGEQEQKGRVKDG